MSECETGECLVAKARGEHLRCQDRCAYDRIAHPLSVESDRDRIREETIRECRNAVPTNWCDPLLTGPNAVIKDLDNRQIEALLRGVQDRILALLEKEK